MAKRHGFPKQIRLCSRKEIGAVFESGEYRRLGVLHAKFIQTDRAEGRFLVSVKKRVGNAPCRNRIKRLVREAVRQNSGLLESSYDVCFFLTQRPEPLQLSVIEADVRRLFEHLNRRISGTGAAS